MPITAFNSILPNIHKNAYIDDSSVIVGDIYVGANSSIWPLVAARGDVNVIRIGERSNIQDGSVLHVSRPSSNQPKGFPLIIGDQVTVGHKCMLHGCIIGDRVLIGMASIVMDGAIVEDDIIIGAGSLVPPNKILERGYLYVGNPCVKKRKLSASELAFLPQSAENYVALMQTYIEQHPSAH